SLHPDKTIPDDAPSRFAKDGAATPASNGHDAAAAPAAPAAAAPAAAPKPVVGVRGRVEKPVARPAPARPARSFAGELAIEYDQLLADLGAPRRNVRSCPARSGRCHSGGSISRSPIAVRSTRSSPRPRTFS